MKQKKSPLPQTNPLPEYFLPSNTNAFTHSGTLTNPQESARVPADATKWGNGAMEGGEGGRGWGDGESYSRGISPPELSNYL